MKKLLSILLTVLIGVSCLSLSAQVNTQLVANGTESSNYVPVYGLWADVAQHNQVVYPAGMLSNMVGGEIQSMKFFFSSAPSNQWSGQIATLRLGTVTAPMITGGNPLPAPGAVVYNGSLALSGDTLVFNFSTPFLYEGGNLLFDLSLMSGGNYSSATFAGVASNAASLYSYDSYGYENTDVVDFIPKTLFAFTGGASCISPDNLTISNITSSGATFSWHPNSTGSYEVCVIPLSDDPAEAVWTTVTDTSHTFTGLLSGTAYMAYVRTDCGGGDISAANNTMFYTTCETVNAFPYTEGFEGDWISTGALNQNNIAPLCWSIYDGGYAESYANYSWRPNQYDDQVYEGQHSAVMYSSSYGGNGHNDWLVSPMMNLTSGLQVSFYAKAYSYYGEPDPEEVSVWISNENASLTAPANNNSPLPGFTRIFNTTITNGEFQIIEVPLTGYTGNRYIALTRDTIPNDGYYLCIDNFAVAAIPVCERPHDLDAVTVGTHSADLTWQTDAPTVNVRYRRADETAFSVVEDVTLNSDSVYVLQGLTPGYQYFWYVEGICSDDTLLASAQTLSFKTECVPTTLPRTWDFETNNIAGTDEDPLPACWNRTNYEYPAVYSYNGVSGSCLSTYGSGDYYVALPELDLTDISIHNLQLSFWAKLSTYDTNGFIVAGVMTDPAASSTFVPLDTLSGLTDEYAEYQAYFTSYDGIDDTARFVALRIHPGQYTSYGYNYDNTIYMDNVSLEVIPACARPENVTVSNITTTSVNVSWTPAQDVNEYTLYYIGEGETAYTQIEDGPVADSVYSLSDLLPGTQYTLLVASLCGDGTETNALPVTFVTNCVAIDTLPYTCGFESDFLGADYPLTRCWTRGNPSYQTPYCQSYGTHTGTYKLYFYNPNTAALPALNTDDIPVNTTQLSLYAQSPYSGNMTFQVGVMTDPHNENTFVQVGGDLTANSAYQLFEISLDSYTGSGSYVAIRTTSTGYLYVDDVTLDLLPECSRPQAVTANAVLTTEAVIGWTANESQTEWEAFYGPAGSQPDEDAVVSVSTNPFTITDLEPNTSYTVYVRTVCADGTSEWSTACNFMTLGTMPAELPYTCTFEDTVENANWTLVNGNAANHWVFDTAATDTGYSLYITDDSVANYHYSGNTSAVWAYRDIQFSDADEFTLSFDWRCYAEGTWDNLRVFIGNPVAVFSGSSSDPAGSEFIGTFNSSDTWQHFSTLLDGSYANTVKRIYLSWHNDGITENQPPAAIDNFSVEAVSCARPAAVNFTEINTDGATLVITPASESDALWLVSLNDSTFTVTDPTVVLTNLTPATNYTVTLRTICDAGDTSAVTEPVVFQTACLVINSVPQTWDFEGDNIGGTYYNPLPVCWNRTNSTYPYVYNYDALSGFSCLYFSNSNANTIAVMPELDELLDIQTLQLTFYAKTSALTTARLEVGVMTDPTDASTFVPVQSLALGTEYSTDPIVVNLTNYNGTGRYIALKNAYNSSAYTYFYVDDITLQEIPACPPPTAVSVSGITDNSAVIAWTENGDATSWEILVGDSLVSADANPFTVTNLMSGTYYSVKVRALCGGEATPYSGTTTFKTECSNVSSFPYVENFDGGDLGCWTNETITSESWTVSGTYSVSGFNSAYFPYTTGASARLVSPILELTGVTNPAVSFHHRQYPDGAVVDSVSVSYRTSESAEWVRLTAFTTSTGSDFYLDTVQLPSATATYQICFTGYGIYGYGIYLDDITVFSLPSDTTGPQQTDPTVATSAATAVAQTTATLNGTITNPDNVTISAKGFQWKTTTGGTYQTVNATGTGLSYNLTGLTAATNYTYRAFITFNGTTVYGNEVTFTTLEQGVEPCDVPTSLTVASVENHAVTVTWDANSNVNSWNIRYRKAETGSWSSATASTNSYTISDLDGNTDYEIQVQADCGDGNQSDWTTSATAHTTNVGISNWMENSVKVFPNPANDFVNVQCTMHNVQMSADLHVFDVYGKLVQTVPMTGETTAINVSSLADGMYFVRVTTEAGAVAKTFVVKR